MAVIDTAYSHPVLTIAASGLFLLALWTRLTSTPLKTPPNLPWVGRGQGLFAETKATWGSLTKSSEWLAEGYAKYSKQGRAYILPDLSGRHEIVLPSVDTKWLVDQSDTVSSAKAAHFDMLAGDYNFTDNNIAADTYHEHIVHKNLPRKVDAITPAVREEIENSFDHLWGDSEDWHDIPVWDSLMAMMARVANRIFVGLPLCRNKDFLKNNAAFAIDVITVASLLPFFPKFLHPIVGRVMTLPNQYHYWRTSRHSLPLIKKRLADIEAGDANPAAGIAIPEDYVTWHIRTARAEGKTCELTPDRISRRLMTIEFAAIHTTTLTITMALFDIFSSDPADGYVEGLREECARVLSESDGVWNKKSLAQLVRTDSALRESMRVSCFGQRGLQRKIVSPEGLTHETEGWTAPLGSYISLDAYNRMHDPDIYPQPDKFDAFRFSRPREEFAALGSEEKDSGQYLNMLNQTMTSTGPDFIVFGHGRNACPGRFLVQHELKILLAHILLNYDVKQLPVRPANQLLGVAVLPPMKAKLTVRKRAAV